MLITNSLPFFITNTPLHLLLVLILISYWTLWILYTLTIHPLAKYPGPLLARISRLWVVSQVLSGKAEKNQRVLHEKYGLIIRIAPNELAIADPEAINTIYGTRSGFTKTDFYPPFEAHLSKYPNHFTSLDEKVHADRRRIVNKVYSMSNIVQSEVYIDTCSEMFLKRIGEFAKTGEIIDLARWNQMFVADLLKNFVLYFTFQPETRRFITKTGMPLMSLENSTLARCLAF